MPRFASQLHEALRSILLHPLRAALTALGIVVGVAAVIVVLAIGEGSRQEVLAQIRSLGGNLLLITPGSARQGGIHLGAGSRPSLREEDGQAIRTEVEGVSFAAPSVFRRAQVIRGHLNRATTVQGITPDYLRAREWAIAAGRPFSEHDQATGAKVALLGSTVADHLFPDRSPLGELVRVGTAPLKIVGVLETKGQSTGGADQDDKLMIPLSTASARVLGSGRARLRDVQYIMVKVERDDGLDTTEEEIRALLRQRHRTAPGVPDDFSIRNLAELQSQKEAASGVLGFWLTAVASVSLIVGAISVANIMLVAVAERTREIGLRLAVGARPSDVRNQFLLEAVLIAISGGVIGTGCGLVFAWATALWGGIPVVIRLEAVLLGLGASAITGVAAGILPALRAASLAPIAALRSD